MKVSGVFYVTKLWGVLAILHMGLNAFVAFEVIFLIAFKLEGFLNEVILMIIFLSIPFLVFL